MMLSKRLGKISWRVPPKKNSKENCFSKENGFSRKMDATAQLAALAGLEEGEKEEGMRRRRRKVGKYNALSGNTAKLP
jgi:hypothetical protein